MNKVYGTCKFSVTNNNNLLLLLTFSQKKNSFCFCCRFRTKCDCETTAQMNQLWKREKNLWWCLCTQQSFNLSGGGTVRRMTVGGFIIFICILIMCIHLKNNPYCIFSRSTFWINSGDEFLNKFLCWYFIIIMGLSLIHI